MRTLTLLVLVLCIIATIHASTRNLCETHSCGACCQQDLAECCTGKKWDQTANTLTLAEDGAVLQSQEEQESTAALLSDAEIDTTVLQQQDKDETAQAFTEASSKPSGVCFFNCSKFRQAGTRQFICSCPNEKTIVQHQFLHKNGKCFGVNDMKKVNTEDQFTYVAQALLQCVSKGCECRQVVSAAELE